jgi:hypothetical protein
MCLIGGGQCIQKEQPLMDPFFMLPEPKMEVTWMRASFAGGPQLMICFL